MFSPATATQNLPLRSLAPSIKMFLISLPGLSKYSIGVFGKWMNSLLSSFTNIPLFQNQCLNAVTDFLALGGWKSRGNQLGHLLTYVVLAICFTHTRNTDWVTMGQGQFKTQSVEKWNAQCLPVSCKDPTIQWAQKTQRTAASAQCNREAIEV